MAFTNIWDDTFPQDTQLANLLGQDLRNFRTDTQERMAAISGLDAVKPNFAGDTQPAKWNGILFFATDTGRIYQFNNPAWTDVTHSFVTSGLKFNNSNSGIFINAPGTQTYLTIPAGTLITGNHVRFVYSYTGIALNATTVSTIQFAGNNITLPTQIGAPSGLKEANGVIDIIVTSDTTVLSQAVGVHCPQVSTVGTLTVNAGIGAFGVPSLAANNSNFDLVVTTTPGISIGLSIVLAEVF